MRLAGKEDLAAIKKSGSRPGPTLNLSLLSESYEMSLTAHIGERRRQRKGETTEPNAEGRQRSFGPS